MSVEKVFHFILEKTLSASKKIGQSIDSNIELLEEKGQCNVETWSSEFQGEIKKTTSIFITKVDSLFLQFSSYEVSEKEKLETKIHNLEMRLENLMQEESNSILKS